MKAQVACLMDESTAMKREIESFRQSAKTAAREKFALQEEFNHKCNYFNKIKDRVRRLERQVEDINEQTMRNTQVEQSEIEEKLKYLEQEVEKVEILLFRLKEEENSLMEKVLAGRKELEHIEDMGVTVVNISATTLPQTLDWLHNYLLQRIEEGIRSSENETPPK